MCSKVSGRGSCLSYVALGCRGGSLRSWVSAPRTSQAAFYCSDSPADTLATWNASFSRFFAKKLAAPNKNVSGKPCQQPLEAAMFITHNNTEMLNEMDNMLTNWSSWRLTATTVTWIVEHFVNALICCLPRTQMEKTDTILLPVQWIHSRSQQ